MTLEEFKTTVAAYDFDPDRAFETVFDNDPIYQVQRETSYLVYNLRRKKWHFRIFLDSAGTTPQEAMRKSLSTHEDLARF